MKQYNKTSFIGRIKTFLSIFFVIIMSCVTAVTLLSANTLSLNVQEIKNLTVEEISVSGNVSWTVDDDSITGVATGAKGSGCSSDSAASGSIRLVNDKLTTGTLSFYYKIVANGGNATIDDGTAIGENVDNVFFSKELKNGDSITIKIQSATGAKTTQIIMSTVNFVVSGITITTTFAAPSNGNYTVTLGEQITEFTENTTESKIIVNDDSSRPYKLSARPSTGYRFHLWQKEKDGVISTISKDIEYDYYAIDDCIVSALFVDENAATFTNSGLEFVDLNEAIQSATSSNDKTIVVSSDGSVSAGEYTIPSNVTLLVPFDGANTIFKEYSRSDYVSSSPAANSLYRKLILNDGVILNINGVLAVESKLSATGAGGSSKNGTPCGSFGELYLNQNAKIFMNSGSYLYAWGYITGDGIITARNGSIVYEAFQIKNFRGGNATNGMNRNKQNVFMFNQYYVQNIECYLVLEYGAIEKCCSAISVSILGVQNTTVDFVSNDMGTALFKLKSGGRLTKRYNYETNRLELKVNGDAIISNLKVNINVTIDSSEYVLPIGHNMDLIIDSNSNVSVNQDLAFLPNSALIINNGGNLIIESPKRVYIYDSDEWQKDYDYSAIYYPYCATLKKNYGSSTVYSDAIVDINGEIKVKGNLYTTKSGAEIISSEGTGKVTFDNGGASDSVTYQAIQSSNKIDSYPSIDVNSAKLKNLDDSYFETTNLNAGDVVTYNKEKGKWGTNEVTQVVLTLTFKGPNGKVVEQYTTEFTNNSSFTFPKQPVDWTGFTIFGWQSEINGTIYELGQYFENINLSGDTNFIAISEGWIFNSLSNDYYYYNEEFKDNSKPGRAIGLASVVHKDTNKQQICYFNSDGVFQQAFEGVLKYSKTEYVNGDDCYYYISNGVVTENAGLKKVDDPLTRSSKYYYFGADNKAYTGGTFYISSNLNGFLCPGTYTFTNEGYIQFEESKTFNFDSQIHVDSNTCYIDGIKVGYGLFAYEGHYYYAKSDGTIAIDSTIYINKDKANGLISSYGVYYFDENGYLCDETLTPVEVK